MRRYYLGLLFLWVLTWEPPKNSNSQDSSKMQHKDSVKSSVSPAQIYSVIDERKNLINKATKNDKKLFEKKEQIKVVDHWFFTRTIVKKVHDTIYVERCDTVKIPVLKIIHVPVVKHDSIIIKKHGFLYKLFHRKKINK